MYRVQFLVLSQVFPLKFQQAYFVTFMVTQLSYDKLCQKPKYSVLHDFNEFSVKF